MPRHNPLVRVHHMLDHAQEAVELARDRCRADLDSDRVLNLALVRLMEIVGEAASRTPDDFRQLHPAVPWRDISDLRHRLVHGYDSVNFDILWQVIQGDLPSLIVQLDAIVRQYEQ